MKVLQYNIYFGKYSDISIEKRIENICNCILDQEADILCLQEVLCDMYDFVVSLLKDTYPYVYPNPEQGLVTTYETVIFSKYPILKSTKYKYEFTNMGRDMKLILIADENGSKYYICTSHFESEFKDGCMKKKFQYRRCADILQNLYKKTNIPIIFCTDTNVCPISEKTFYDAFSYARAWKDTWIETGACMLNEITFDSETNPILKMRYNNDMKYNPNNLNKQNIPKYKTRLDRILHISNFYAVDFKLFGTDDTKILSDHYGITCNFTTIKPENRSEYVPPHTSTLSKQKLNIKKLF